MKDCCGPSCEVELRRKLKEAIDLRIDVFTDDMDSLIVDDRKDPSKKDKNRTMVFFFFLLVIPSPSSPSPALSGATSGKSSTDAKLATDNRLSISEMLEPVSLPVDILLDCDIWSCWCAPCPLCA